MQTIRVDVAVVTEAVILLIWAFPAFLQCLEALNMVLVPRKHVQALLELCMQNRNLEGVTEDPKDWMTSISGCQCFAFSFADALEFPRT